MYREHVVSAVLLVEVTKIWSSIQSNDGTGLKFLTPIGSGQLFVGQVGSAILVWVWFQKFPLIPKFKFFPFGSKKYLWVGSKCTQVKDRSA